jgi:hypothetical protein
MVINFMARGISRGARKLTQTPILIKKNMKSLDPLDLIIYLEVVWKCDISYFLK